MKLSVSQYATVFASIISLCTVSHAQETILPPASDTVSLPAAPAPLQSDTTGDTAAATSIGQKPDVPDRPVDTAAAATVSDTTTPLKPSAPPDSTGNDTLKLVNGISYGGEFGWSLGGFALTEYWEDALPDSLGSFGLSTTSFVPDSATIAAGATLFDTAALVYTVKEKPSVYTMSFPVALSLVSISDARRLSLSLRGSWMRKVLISSIGFKDDTTGAKIDYRQSINIYSAFISAAYGFRIPAEYFSIEGIERCYFTTGIDLSPLIYATIASVATATSGDTRFEAIRKQCAAPGRTFRGGAAAARFGLNMLKRINRSSATDVSIAYSLQAYGYFFDHGDRVSIKDVNPDFTRKDRPLFWVSSRFEIAIALLHLPRQ